MALRPTQPSAQLPSPIPANITNVHSLLINVDSERVTRIMIAQTLELSGETNGTIARIDGDCGVIFTIPLDTLNALTKARSAGKTNITIQVVVVAFWATSLNAGCRRLLDLLQPGLAQRITQQ